jgi:hypothetical protein
MTDGCAGKESITASYAATDFSNLYMYVANATFWHVANVASTNFGKHLGSRTLGDLLGRRICKEDLVKLSLGQNGGKCLVMF